MRGFSKSSVVVEALIWFPDLVQELAFASFLSPLSSFLGLGEVLSLNLNRCLPGFFLQLGPLGCSFENPVSETVLSAESRSAISSLY